MQSIADTFKSYFDIFLADTEHFSTNSLENHIKLSKNVVQNHKTKIMPCYVVANNRFVEISSCIISMLP